MIVSKQFLRNIQLKFNQASTRNILRHWLKWLISADCLDVCLVMLWYLRQSYVKENNFWWQSSGRRRQLFLNAKHFPFLWKLSWTSKDIQFVIAFNTKNLHVSKGLFKGVDFDAKNVCTLTASSWKPTTVTTLCLFPHCKTSKAQ